MDNLVFDFEKEFKDLTRKLNLDKATLSDFEILFNQCENLDQKKRMYYLSIDYSDKDMFLHVCNKDPQVYSYKILNGNSIHSVIYKVKRNIFNFFRKGKSNLNLLYRKIEFCKFIESYCKDEVPLGDEHKYSLDNYDSKKIKLINEVMTSISKKKAILKDL